MKTEMKKNKLVLALAVVAAFAMVSVAGIAVLQSDDSDAAATEGVFSPLVAAPTGPFIINASVTSSYDFYVNEGATFGALVIVVQENVNYNGILRIGVMSADKVYTPYTSIELKNASAVQLTAMAINTDVTGFVSLFEIGNLNKDFGGALPQGDFEVKQGQVMLGSATVDVDQYDWNYFASGMDNLTDINDFLWYLANGFDYMVDEEKMVSFSGKITAGEFSATANYVAGTYISVDSAGNARVSGVAVSPNEMLPYDTVNSKYPAFEDRTLIFEGKASIQFPEAIQKLLDRNLGDLDVSTAYLSSQLPSIGDILSMTYLPATGSFDLFATDSVNVTVAEGAVITTGDRPATVAASVELKVGTADTVVGAFLIGSDGSSYKADITGLAGDSAVFEFVPFGTYTLIVYNGVGLDLKVWYSTNAVVSESGLTLGSSGLSAPSSDLLPGAEPEYLKYNEADYTFEFAFDTTGYGGLGKLKEAGIIEFSDDVTGQDIFAVLKSKGAGHPLEFFYGNLSNEAAGTLTATALATVPSGSIKAGDVASAGAISAYVSLDAPSRPAKITVMGEMNFIYTSDDVQGLMVIGQSDSKLTFEGTGIVSQGVKPTQTVPPRGIEESVNLVAARYFVNEPATGTVKEKTYYYTTLNNAITKNNVITLLGDHVILVDTTLDNSEFDSIEIIIDSSASLSVGRDDDPDTEEDESASPILTVPAKTTLVALSGADYEVVSGQAVYDVKPAASDEPESDILIEGNKFIYTDLATALDISVSGDVLELLRFADLKRNATLKSGVELNDDYGINIPEEITLTVDGTFTSTGDSLIEGTVRILGTATFTDSSYAEFGPSGAIDIASSGTLTVDDSTILGDHDVGAISVAGKIFVKNDAVVVAGTVIVTGNVSVTGATSFFGVFDKLVIGEVPTLSPLSAAYTNTASITGAVTLGPDAVAYVYGSFSVGTGANAKIKFSSGTELLKTAYNIEGTVYVTLYADDVSAPVLPILFEDQLKDITILGWNNERLLRGDWVDGNQMIGDAGWENVYADWEWKMYDITLSYLQGMTWVVDGVNFNGGVVIQAHYGQKITVTASVQPGFEGTPVLKANGGSYNAGTAFEVKENTVFTATGVQQASSGGDDDKGGLTLIEILLIVIVVIIAVIAIIVAIRLMRS